MNKDNNEQDTDLAIPSARGFIFDRVPGPADAPFLAHISDAHCNAEAQRNIAEIGRHLVDQHGFRLFAVEGTPGPIDVRWLRGRHAADPSAIDRQRDAGKITGSEWLAVSHAETLMVHGIEDADLYRRNHAAMVEVMRESEPAAAWLSRLRGALLGQEGTPEMWAKHRLLGVLTDGVSLRLMRERYLANAKALAALDLAALVEEIASLSERVAGALAPGLASARRAAAGALAFYECAVARDGVLFRNALAAMRRHGVGRAIVVTGGFHVGGFHALAREQGVRMVFIRPQISWSGVHTEEAKYKTIMAKQAVACD